MIFPRNKREAAPVEKTAADYFQKTSDLLEKAMMERGEPSLRAAAHRIDGARFNELTDDQQVRLLVLFARALAANGALAP